MAKHVAASASYADVSTALGLCSDGDILAIPAGTETWDTMLLITVGITVQGAGTGSTVITGTGTTTILEIDVVNDEITRITGICFKFTTNDLGGKCIYVDGRVNAWATRVRIDHCKFEKGTRAFSVRAWVEGVVDNNEFLNNNISVGLTGDNNASWSREIAAGTEHAVFVEDNTFTITNDADREPSELIYHQEGARSVVRYNTFDGTAYTTGNSLFYDSHGNQDYYAVDEFRGQPILEVYNNTMTLYQTYRWFHIRGGSTLIYNNTLTKTTGAGNVFKLTEEESWQTLYFDPLDDTWPAEDQTINSFFWNNTINGSPITDISLGNANDAEFIQEDRDYFFHAPAASGGYGYYDDRPGAAGNGADGTTIFSGSGANMYYPYSAYEYPHPLTKAINFDQGTRLRF